MDLTKLFETQRILDLRIEKEHPRVEGEDRLAKKILALQVELGECANEWRGFKFWSKNQEPKRWKHDDACLYCDGKGVLLDWGSMNFWECGVCKGTGEVENLGDPLLEEYVDCLHFILSIGLEIGIHYFVYNADHRYKEKNITNQFLLVADFTINLRDDDYCSELLQSFVYLGEMLGFAWKQIEQAYYDKNAINHERQDTGY